MKRTRRSAGLAALVGLLVVGFPAGCIRPPTRPPAAGCTAFVLHTGPNALVGKNLDWPVGEGAVLVNPRGLAKTAWVGTDESTATWVSEYASVTFNQLGREFPLGGLNEAGLVVEELSYGPARYPATEGRPAVNELQWIQYHLDRHATVAEVISDTVVRIAPLLFGLHYLVADASGDVAIIEFLNGSRVIYTGPELPVAVLANDSYGNLVRYLGMHAGFGGSRLPGPGPESPERFVRAATAIRRLERSGVQESEGVIGVPEAPPVDSAFAVLADVAQDDTQWSLVYDPGELTVSYRTAANPERRAVRLADFAGSCDAGPYGLPIDARVPPEAGWNAWTVDQNTELVTRAFEALGRAELESLPSDERVRAMARYPERMVCARP